jgi:hypothetical protein
MIELIPELILFNPLIPLTLHNISGDWQARSNPYKRGSCGYQIFERSITLSNLNHVLNMEIGKQEAIRTNGEPAATTFLSLQMAIFIINLDLNILYKIVNFNLCRK